MIYLAYDILLHLAMLVSLPYFLIKMLTVGKYRRGIPERFGFINKNKFAPLSGARPEVNRVVWIHAVSVGETKAVIPLLKLLKNKHPEYKIVFSTVTPTGNKVAETDGEGLIDTLMYFPMDLSWVVRNVCNRVRPDVFVLVEKEYWPNIMRSFRRRSVPVVVVNGTMSERSFQRYRKFSFLTRDVFSGITFFCARTERDAEMARELGASANRCEVTGNIKFDLQAPVDDKPSVLRAKQKSMKESFGISPSDMVLVVGSTHPGEEELILNVFKKLKSEFANLKIVIAPRHPERFDEVEGLIKTKGLVCQRRSKMPGRAKGRENNKAAADVIMLDTMGELSLVYSLSTVSVVAGTFVPGIGGHNLLEPSLFSKPVVYGPYLTTYLYMAELLEEKGGGVRAGSGEQGLYKALKELLADKALREETGKAALEVVEANKGATRRALEVIEDVMKKGAGI